MSEEIQGDESTASSSGTDRSSRSDDTREATTARQPWKPPQLLNAPDAPPGMRYRWIRTHIRGVEDRTNVHMRLREGYVPVKPEEVQGSELPTITEGQHAGTVGVGGLILAKIPEETVEERNAYYHKMTDQQMNAVDNDLMRDEHPAMPISRERKSQVTFGSPKKN
tara:strand:+ start:538 stop:1035 length:498 start_codon:yes stop_codon:yes gene_type:complete